MVSALNVPGHRVQPASKQFSTVPQFAREVGVALQACLKDHKPGSLVYRSTVTMRNNFVKVPAQDSTHSLCSWVLLHVLLFEVVEERGKAFICDPLVDVFQFLIMNVHMRSTPPHSWVLMSYSLVWEEREREGLHSSEHLVYVFQYSYNYCLISSPLQGWE